MTASPATRLEEYRARIEWQLDRCLPPESASPERLHQAIRYAVLNGGKRLRPQLVFATAELFGLAPARVDGAAVAVELVHCYSLVHDDLPAMDDDDLRRGQPTTHRRYDEATAILVGDALQMLAFEILATDRNLPADAKIRLEMVRLLAEAGGSLGMTGGQALDLAAEGTHPTEAELDRIHDLKTGRLILASVLMGAAAAGASAAECEALKKYGKAAGLAFQVRDDLLDVEGDTVTLGKPQGSDAALKKATYPSLFGIEASRRKLDALRSEALAALEPFGARADTLRGLTAKLIDRQF